MHRLVTMGLSALLLAPACGGGGGGGGADGGTGSANSGFVKPSETTKAFHEVDGQWELVGDADWSCLNTPTDDQATTVDITLSGSVLDFQNETPLDGAMITAFDDTDFSGTGVATATSDTEGHYEIVLPKGGVRWAFKLEDDKALDTYRLNQYFEPDVADQTADLDSVSILTAESLPAFIGVTRTQGLGILAGAIRDCNENEVQGAIATVSSVSGSPEHLDGAVSYYFSAESTSLPVRHSQQLTTNTDGLFVVIELPVSSEAYVQIWGFPDQDALDSGDMTLLAEIPSPIVADSVVTASLVPLRTN